MKPVLLWPMANSAIAANFDRPAEYFAVADTQDTGTLGELAGVRPDTLVLDPFPDRGQHHRAYLDHVQATGCRHHVVGLAPCQDVVRALKDPSLARASTEELLLALGYLTKN
jgi:hypothetical protein